VIALHPDSDCAKAKCCVHGYSPNLGTHPGIPSRGNESELKYLNCPGWQSLCGPLADPP